jgi:hypothetical protein
MNYSPMPLRIETERLLLTPEERKDAEWFTELLNARGTGTFTIEDARERIDAMTVTIETVGIGALVIRTWPGGDASLARCWRPPSKPDAVVSGPLWGRGTLHHSGCWRSSGSVATTARRTLMVNWSGWCATADRPTDCRSPIPRQAACGCLFSFRERA